MKNQIYSHFKEGVIMNKLIISFVFSFLIILQFGFSKGNADKSPSYVGTSTCGMCHKSEKQGEQLGIWQKSAHAKAYKTLMSDEANKIASEKGFSTKAVETEACLKCHASGYNVDASMKDAKFSVEDGVQCETCHGPGSEYKSMKVMKDKKEAVANGLLVYDNVETFCKKCHNAESPTFKEFKFDEMWAKIKHDIPASK